MDSQKTLIALSGKAINSYKKSDKEKWIFNLMCSRIVSNPERGIKYERGATNGLASDAGVSVDTVENGAHAYWMFEDLCNVDGGKYRQYVFAARRSQYIHTAHFRALYDYRIDYDLDLSQIMDLLVDVVQAEGSISSRGLEAHLIGKYGDTRPWEYYAQKTLKQVHKTLQHPGLPDDVREVLTETFNKLGDRA